MVLIFMAFIICQFLSIVMCDFSNIYFEKWPTKLKEKSEIQPWSGLLRVKQKGKVDSATGLILIAKKAGIACANDVAKISKTSIREKTSAIFFSESIKHPQICTVTDYLVHPEYGNVTTNTFAIVKLQSNDPTFEWKLISWPTSTKFSPKMKLFAFGYSDENKILEQRRYPMVQVNRVDCLEFYNKEGINFKELWPSHFECYKRVYCTKTCVDDAGMALIRRHENQSTLIGMSTYGPGCVLPARYIEFAPYIPWIKDTLNDHYRRSDFKIFQGFRRKSKDARKYVNLEEFTALPNVTYENKIQMHLNKIRDDELVMQLGSMDEQLGNCSVGVGLRPMYIEEGFFNVGLRQSARIIYAVSIYDLRFSNITCVKAKVNCTSHSNITLEFAKGFGHDDVDPYIRHVPIKSPIKDPAIPVRVLEVTGSYAIYRDINVGTVYFRFDFTTCAAIRVEFWGLRKHDTDSDTTRTTRKPTTSTRSYTPHSRG